MMLGDFIEIPNAAGPNETMKTLNDEGTGVTAALGPNSRSRPLTKSELRQQNRQRTSEQVEKSASMAKMYPWVKSLSVDLLYFDRGIVSSAHGLRYRANLAAAKSMLHFHCPSSLCKDGGFDLSKKLNSAVSEHQKSIVGAMRCLGTRDQQTGEPAPCETVLHFKMNLTFKARAGAKRAGAARKSGPVRSPS